jgi:hypothetical protein
LSNHGTDTHGWTGGSATGWNAEVQAHNSNAPAAGFSCQGLRGGIAQWVLDISYCVTRPTSGHGNARRETNNSIIDKSNLPECYGKQSMVHIPLLNITFRDSVDAIRRSNLVSFQVDIPQHQLLQSQFTLSLHHPTATSNLHPHPCTKP